MSADGDSVALFFVPHLRIHDYGCFGAPSPVPLLCAGEMERQSIEETLDACSDLSLLFFSHRFPSGCAQTCIVGVPY